MKWRNLTEQFARYAGAFLTVKPEYIDSRGYEMFNDGGVECETGEFLYGLVRLIKPEHILETGTHLGVSASYMAQALQDNGRGEITTVEFAPGNYHKSGELFEVLNLSEQITRVLGDSSEFMPPDELDVLFLDTEPNLRFGELMRFYTLVKPGGFILIHDLHPHMHQVENKEHGFAWPYGQIPKAMAALVRSDKLRPIHFQTPRGLTMFYKTNDVTYRWPKGKNAGAG